MLAARAPTRNVEYIQSNKAVVVTQHYQHNLPTPLKSEVKKSNRKNRGEREKKK